MKDWTEPTMCCTLHGHYDFDASECPECAKLRTDLQTRKSPMMEVDSEVLQASDEFTKDNGETWLRVKVVRFSTKGKRVIVIDTDNKEHILRYGQKVIVRI